MFYHNFKYTLKTLLRNKGLIFWTFAFPLILGTFFHLAFSDIESKESLDIIDIAVVESSDFKDNEIFNEALQELSKKDSSNQLFNITYTTKENASSLLEDSKISGYLTFKDDDVNITVKTNGINETILRFVVSEITSEKELMETIIKTNVEDSIKNNVSIDYSKITEDALNLINSTEVNIKDVTNSNISYTMIEYYTLIAMACMYGAILAIYTTNKKLANMSSAGKRTSISPAHKGKTLLASLFASYLVQILGIAILFIYTIFVLKVDYGSRLPETILLALAGSLAGLSLGVALATLLKTNENNKTGILISVTMVCCFLSGMMGITMKYVIDKNVPWLNWINPANMITDGLYSLYYYETLNRYYFNIISLLIFSFILLLMSYQGLRRQKYDSI